MLVPYRSAWLGASLAILLAACGGKPPAGGQGAPAAAPAGAEEKIVNLYIWSDYMSPDTLPGFEKETGIKVNVDVFDSNEVLETKLLAGSSGYDVVVPSAYFLERQIKAGVYRRLDPELLPNLKNADPAIAKLIARHDPGNEHAVDYMWGTTGLGFDAEKLRKRMPDAPLDSWRLLLDPKVVAKFADCGVAVLDSPTDVVAAALQYLGKDPNSESPDDLKVAEAALMAIRPHIRYVNSQRYIEDLANGEICLALGYSGDILQARNRARDAGKTHSVTFLNPKEGGQIWFDTLAIPADAPHPGNAHRLIDYLMRPEVAAKNAAFLRYGSGVGSAAALQPPEVRDDPGINPPPEVRERLVSLLAKSPQYTQLLTRSWTRFRTGR